VWRALDAGRLCLYYQPLISLGNGNVAAVEALLRIQPEPGSRSSGIVSVGEQANQIGPLGRWVVTRAVSDAANLGFDIPTLVNMSPWQLSQEDLTDHMAGALEVTGRPASLVGVEVTESSPVTPAAEAALWEMHAMGIGVVLDDLNSLDVSALGSCPVSTIKLDRKVIAGLTPGTARYAGLARTVRFAHSMGITVVAEGVETAEERSACETAGFDFAQGYLFSAAVSADRVLPLIDRLHSESGATPTVRTGDVGSEGAGPRLAALGVVPGGGGG
jgi:EAL domain-containing protein (putative c-di-GMP-specific phosphodiesterase class I)